MVAVLTRSIDTGDSKILSGTLEAETTTSLPSVKEGSNETSTPVFAALTVTSLFANPTEENTNVTG
jgi:hypothetical protein